MVLIHHSHYNAEVRHHVARIDARLPSSRPAQQARKILIKRVNRDHVVGISLVLVEIEVGRQVIFARSDFGHRAAAAAGKREQLPFDLGKPYIRPQLPIAASSPNAWKSIVPPMSSAIRAVLYTPSHHIDR